MSKSSRSRLNGICCRLVLAGMDTLSTLLRFGRDFSLFCGFWIFLLTLNLELRFFGLCVRGYEFRVITWFEISYRILCTRHRASISTFSVTKAANLALWSCFTASTAIWQIFHLCLVEASRVVSDCLLVACTQCCFCRAGLAWHFDIKDNLGGRLAW